jgi:ubiquinone/menaquinone biosynthesis C-methylase UbiE
MEGSEIKDNNPGAPEVFEEYWGKMESHLRSRYSEGNILRYNEYTMYLVNTLIEELTSQNCAYHAVELGCGRGDSSLFFAKKGWQTVLVDLSEVVLHIAKQNFIV